ncbi:MAG: hypothetical protein CVV44_14505 [Spirochaetae bacterium HGW-Spirochaetae-1]|nr:MAG: hypothetical protein CVV44_14505 [Spirochaetae bacterium HGW-Spirochaetae-1]
MKIIISCISLLAVAVHFTCSPAASRPPLEQWGYVLHSAPQDKACLDRALRRFSVLAVTGFSLDRKGALMRSGGSVVKKILNDSGVSAVTVYPLITFASPADGVAFLDSPPTQAAGITAIKNMTNTLHVPGIHLDFEYLSGAHALKLKAFIQHLRLSLQGKTVTMAVFPSVEFPEKWSSFHDLSLLDPVLDEIVLMCYDYHRPGTKPGPVTDLDWVEKNIISALKHVGPGKVWLGVPAYGYSWPPAGKPRVITEKEGLRLGRQYGSSRDPSGTLFVQYVRNGVTRRAWFADIKTRERLAGLAEKYHLRGTALWRIGFEETP